MAFAEDLCPIIHLTPDLEQEIQPSEPVINLVIEKSPIPEIVIEKPKQSIQQIDLKPALKKNVNFQQPIDKVIPDAPINNTTSVIPIQPNVVIAKSATLAIPSMLLFTKNVGVSIQSLYLLVILIIFGLYIFHENKFPKN